MIKALTCGQTDRARQSEFLIMKTHILWQAAGGAETVYRIVMEKPQAAVPDTGFGTGVLTACSTMMFLQKQVVSGRYRHLKCRVI